MVCYRFPITKPVPAGNEKLNQKNPVKHKLYRVQKIGAKKNPVKHKLYGVCTTG
jgi:hypothetical protein